MNSKSGRPAIPATEPLSSLDGVRARFLRADERPYVTGEGTLPWVIEARDFRDAAALEAFVSRHSPAIRSAIYECGAVLFRGFQIDRDVAFENVVLSLQGSRPIDAYFMSEPGRERVNGTRGVLNTNAHFKTGGGLFLGGFHSENFYSPDVPALQSFWCKEPPTLGGETVFVQSARMYDELSVELRQRLERGRLFVGELPIESVAARYRMNPTEVEGFFRQVGLEMGQSAEGKTILLFKPAVYRHPQTRRLALQVHISSEVKGFDRALRRLIAPHYQGLRWAVHRLGWRNQTFAELLPFMSSPSQLAGALADRAASALAFARSGRSPKAREPERLADRLKPGDAEELARAAWRHASVFTWRRGDVILFDNLQLLHGGMPGRGRRELRVMMCDPIRMLLPVASGVFDAPFPDSTYESLDAQLQRWRSAATTR